MKFRLALALIILGIAGCAAHSSDSPAARPPTLADRLLGSEWRLEDLAGAGVLDRGEATIVFPEPGRVAGSASCNRFVGTADIGDDNALRIGVLATSRRKCKSAAASKQEAKYLKALGAAERAEIDGPKLLIYVSGFDKPLRYGRKNP